MYKLMKFSSDWADEFQVEGFSIVTDEFHKLLIECINQIGNLKTSWYFGTNEGFNEPFKDLFSSCTFESLNEEEALKLSKLFKLSINSYDCFGNCPYFPELFDNAELCSTQYDCIKQLKTTKTKINS